MIELTELLEKAKLDPKATRVMRHVPTEPALRKALPWMASERHSLYNAYQSHHSERVEKSLARASHLVSFIGHRPGQALFVGIYCVSGYREISEKDFRAMPCNEELGRLGTRGPGKRRRSLWFDLQCTEHLAEWKGKLVVNWPPPERSWWRLAHRNRFRIHAVHEESVLIPPMPKWNELLLDCEEFRMLPKSWQLVVSQWRGVYHILDRASGKSYVGSAYGDDNIYGRWCVYADTGHGDNIDLKGLDPSNFRFSILERVSPDMPAEDVIRLESNWKDRLGTRECGLNAN